MNKGAGSRGDDYKARELYPRLWLKDGEWRREERKSAPSDEKGQRAGEISRRVLRSKSFTAPPKDYQNYSLNYLACPFLHTASPSTESFCNKRGRREEGNLSEMRKKIDEKKEVGR